MDRSRTRVTRRVLISGAIAIAVAACGTSTPGATTAGSQAQPVAGPTSGSGATTGTVPTTGTVVTTQPGDGGGLVEAQDFCLNTPEEVATGLGVGAVTAAGSANPGLGGGCLYSDATGKVVYAISVVLGSSAAQTFEAFTSTEGVEEVAGIGDRAIYLPMNALVGIAFLKGEVLASMSPTPGLAIQDDPTALRAALAELARQAAGRA
jgi:hypothetical protein